MTQPFTLLGVLFVFTSSAFVDGDGHVLDLANTQTHTFAHEQHSSELKKMIKLIVSIPDGNSRRKLEEERQRCDHSAVLQAGKQKFGAILLSALCCILARFGDIGLLLNKKKTQVMFLKPRGQHDPVDRVRCNGDDLATMSSAKYLSVNFHDDLSWRSHIQHLASQTGKAVSRLWRHGDALSITARRILLP